MRNWVWAQGAGVWDEGGAGELHAKLGVGSGTWEVTARCESCGIEEARLRHLWAAGPGNEPTR